MAAGDATEATALGFHALADLVHGGVGGRVAAWCAEVPGLAETVAGLDPSSAAELHTRVTLLEAPPFASLYLHPQGLLSGEIASDHAAAHLSALGHLVGSEDPGAARAAARLLRWLPAWVAALAEVAGAGVYREGGDLAVAMAAGVAGGGTDEAWTLEGEPVALGADVGVDEIARALCVPARAGGFLVPSAIRAIGRALELPRAIGPSRAAELGDLFRAAAHFRRVPELCAALDARFAGFGARWEEVASQGAAACAAPWLARIERTRAVLRDVAAAARE